MGRPRRRRRTIPGRAKNSPDGPSNLTLPCSRATTRSATSTSSISCVTTTIVMPPARSRRTASSRSSRPAASSIAVGSSSTSTRRGTARTPASAVRCFWPPERRCGSLRRSFSRSNRASISSVRARILSEGHARFSRPNATSSSTCSATSWFSGFWKRTPTSRRTASRPASLSRSQPQTLASRPAESGASPPSTRARVDLPEPFGPTTAIVSPSPTVRSRPASASHSAPG